MFHVHSDCGTDGFLCRYCGLGSRRMKKEYAIANLVLIIIMQHFHEHLKDFLLFFSVKFCLFISQPLMDPFSMFFCKLWPSSEFMIYFFSIDCDGLKQIIIIIASSDTRVTESGWRWNRNKKKGKWGNAGMMEMEKYHNLAFIPKHTHTHTHIDYICPSQEPNCCLSN